MITFVQIIAMAAHNNTGKEGEDISALLSGGTTTETKEEKVVEETKTVTSSAVEMLETLPNIDINIKCGNSLIARFGLDADLKEALKKSKLKIEDYKRAVDQYRNAESKEQKRDMETLIAEIKTNFRTEINQNGKEIKELQKLKYEFNVKFDSAQLFETKLTKAEQKAKKDLADKIDKIETQLEEIKSNKIYENAFEWRFEFPEVLNDEGDFVGFDVVIGNPPYLGYSRQDETQKEDMKIVFSRVNNYKKLDYIACWFYKGTNYIQNTKAKYAFVTTNSITQGEQVALLWPLVLSKGQEIDFAHQSFKWSNNARSNAGVTCIIIGLQHKDVIKTKTLINNLSKSETKSIAPSWISSIIFLVFSGYSVSSKIGFNIFSDKLNFEK